MQKASFHTHSTHTHPLLSRGLQKHCKGKARPYTKITSPIPKMQLLLWGDLLTSESDTYGSLAGRGKTHTKGYFSSNMPLFMQGMVVGSLSIKRKCSREAETPILLRGRQVSRAPCRGAEPCQPSAASSWHSSARPPLQRGRGSAHPLQNLRRLPHHLPNLMVVSAIV